MAVENSLYYKKSLRTVVGKTADFSELAKDCVAFANSRGAQSRAFAVEEVAKILEIKLSEAFKIIDEMHTSGIVTKYDDKDLYVLSGIEKNGFITALQLSQILQISLRKTKENISKLKEKGLIRRVGADKGGHWEII